jgi:flagellin-specific chaperone FliS
VSHSISSIDNERVKTINSLMDEMYSHLPNIYESLVDKDLHESQEHIDALIDLLNMVKDSIDDEL